MAKEGWRVGWKGRGTRGGGEGEEGEKGLRGGRVEGFGFAWIF